MGKSPGEGNDNRLQYSRLENPKDRGARRATDHGVARESGMNQQLNNKSQIQVPPPGNKGNKDTGSQLHYHLI